jgi:hypothetical protein
MHGMHPELSALVLRQHHEDLRQLAGHSRAYRDARAARRGRSRPRR